MARLRANRRMRGGLDLLARRADVGYLLALRAQFWPWDPRVRDYPGMSARPAPGFTVAAQRGDLVLYRLPPPCSR